MTPEHKEAGEIARQQREWANDLRGAATGNPYATLCNTCMGRHAPPRHERCPRKSA
jgi:hypothetical protein